MKTLIFLALTVAVTVKVAQFFRDWETREAAMEELDQVLKEILGDCLEAYCDECDGVLAQGTGQYKEDVFTVAYNHREIYDHDVRVRSWAD